MAKKTRARYDTHTYVRLSTELLTMLEATPHLQPDREEWDLEGDWSKAGAIHFIDAVYQPSFSRFAQFDCRYIKLLNLGHPAVKITFYFKHKYWTIKHTDLTPTEREELINAYINGLIVGIEIVSDKLKSGKITLSSPKRLQLEQDRTAMREELRLFQQVRDEPDRFDLAVSNYNRNHIYTYVNWKFETGTLEYENRQEHCLTDQRDQFGQVTQVRHNVLFVDSQEILRVHHYQNRLIERYLQRFSHRTQFNRDHLYVRERSEPNDLENFEAIETLSEDLETDKITHSSVKSALNPSPLLSSQNSSPYEPKKPIQGTLFD